ncbi:type IIL restriction-modification enzyme MmeI [Bythopirellula goksoeyrii]|uniref:MmeI-like N-terminal domain-containing protein n=1 Tax=Bythopirellula goksoeyrii TaxID=1400387 RepID=A0A5B9QBT1_9BACT|nr:type IIL restriction-modification enzyme MmeI [Bythopirellula goksoeyrii]QEG35239.1 hypothetical protein Pr1d_25330 [Bythopirellula goksoeyrii]
MDDTAITNFIDRWKPSGGAERANNQLLLAELCDVLEAPHPDPTVEVESDNRYVFEKNVIFDNGDGTTSTRRIDLYRRGCFVCETKQGIEKVKDLERLVALNHEQTEEEKRGLIRWLRPDYQNLKGQNPDGKTQQGMLTDTKEAKPKATKKKAKITKQPRPKTLSAQAAAVQAILATPADETDLAKHFTRANKERIAELLETLESLVKARLVDGQRYVGV